MCTVRPIKVQWIIACTLVLLSGLTLATTSAEAQGSVNYTGNGGSNSIQGRLVIPAGKRVEFAGLKIILRNTNAGDIWVITDGTGSFSFKNLVPGSYLVTVEGGDLYENAQESVFIDDFSSTSTGDPTRHTPGRTSNLQVYMTPKSHPSDAAAGLIDAKLAQATKPARDKYDEAKKALDKNDKAAAIAALRDAVSADPSFSVAWDELGLLLGVTGDRAASLAAFKRAVEIDPKFTAALLHLGSALVESKEYNGAETYLAATLAIDQSQFLGHYYLGIAEAKLGRLEIAEKAFEKAIDLGGDRISRAHYMLGGVFWAEKEYGKAASELERYLAANPKAPDAEQTRKAISELRSKKT
jgi:Tfp pilus assembly protein PilF